MIDALPDEAAALAALPVYLTRAEVAAFLRVSLRTLDRMIRDGQLTRRRVGGRTVIPRASVRAYLLGIDPENAVIPGDPE